MKKAREKSTWSISSIVSIIILTFISFSCDNVYIDSAESEEIVSSEEITTLNNFFLMNNLDIKIHEIKPAGREVINQVRKFSNENLYLLQGRGSQMNGLIRWNQTEVLTLINDELFIAITEVRNRPENKVKYIYSLMNHEGVIDQYINELPELNDDTITHFSSDETTVSGFNFLNSSGSCLVSGNSLAAKMVVTDPAQFSNSSSGCFEKCVDDTIKNASTAFSLFCIATGPYCAAAIIIACAGKCAIK